MTDGSKPATDPLFELRKLQFEYAWKWFSFHADQRTKVFNFMLILVGVLAAGTVSALDKCLPSAAYAVLCFAGAGLAIIFSLLDRRNRDLVWLGEEALIRLERDVIFADKQVFKDRHDQEKDWGILWRQELGDKAARTQWCKPFFFIRSMSRGKHRIWLPVLSWLIALLFFVAGLFMLINGPISSTIKACRPHHAVLPDSRAYAPMA